MTVGGVIQYEPEVPYLKHHFSFKISYLVIPSFVC